MSNKRLNVLTKEQIEKGVAAVSKVSVGNSSISVPEIQETENDMRRLHLEVSKFRKDMTGSGLGKLDFSGFLQSGGLVSPFLKSIELAMLGPGEVALVARANFESFQSAMTDLSISVGDALLPAVSDVLEAFEPLLDGLAGFVKENPGLVKGLAVAALAFTVLTVAAMGVAAVMGVLTSPIALVAAAIAIAAGLIVANWGAISQFFIGVWESMKRFAENVSTVVKAIFAWSPRETLASAWGAIAGYFQGVWNEITAGLQRAWSSISEFFSQLWNVISAIFAQAWDSIKALFDWSPRAVIESAWSSVTGFFSQLWSDISASLGMAWDLIKAQFNWSPMELIRGLWDPLSGYFSELWDGLQEMALPVMEVFKTLFDWTPLGLIIANWEPITEWFTKWWDKLQGIIAPFKELIGGKIGGLIEMVTGGSDEGDSNASDQASTRRKVSLLQGESPLSAAQASSSLGQSSSALLQQSVLNNRTQLEGGMTVRFENAPAGMRADAPQSNQPNLLLTSRIGYRSLSLGGSHDSQLA